MELSDKIRILRKARGLTQEALGFSLAKVSKDGISRQSVSDWETGKSEPKLENIRDLSSVLDVSFDALLDENIDLNNKDVLNSVLKHLDKDIKTKVNKAFRYNFYSRVFIKKDVIRLIILLAMFILGLALLITGLCLMNSYEYYLYILISGVYLFVLSLGFLGLIIRLIKTIKRGGRKVYVGSITQSHFMINDSKDADYESTLYIPINQISKMELVTSKESNKTSLQVYVKGKNRPIQIFNLEDPEKIINIFQGIESNQKDTLESD